MSHVPRILIIDDNPLEADLLTQAFAAARWEVSLEDHTRADSALPALAAHASAGTSPDLILLDVTLYGQPSVPVLAAIRTLDRPGKKQAVIVMSNVNPTPAIQHQYREQEAFQIIQKFSDGQSLRNFVLHLRQILTADGIIAVDGSAVDGDSSRS
ncbi:MAG: response regulator transcription factor [Planctomycetes bacterium]|nr:response regulator transcription factor [Planctomycetota bacterium]